MAAVYVVVHHALYLQLSKHPGLRLFAFGQYAVEFFIILSGFCLMIPVVRNNGELSTSPRDFFVRRAWRILPTYYIALILSLLWNAFLRNDPQMNPISLTDIAFHVLLIHDAYPPFVHSINNVFWSIGVEWRIYFLFPVILLMWKKWNPFQVTVSVVTISVAVSAVLGTISPSHLTNMSAHFLGLFVMGMLAAEMCFSLDGRDKYAMIREPVLLNKITLIAISCLILVSWLDPISHWKNRPTIIITDVFVGVMETIILIYLAKNATAPNWRFLQWKPFVFVGKFSYSLYLTHMIFLSLSYLYVVDRLALDPLPRVVVGAIIGTPLSLLGAYLFFLVAEKPFLTAGRKRLGSG